MAVASVSGILSCLLVLLSASFYSVLCAACFSLFCSSLLCLWLFPLAPSSMCLCFNIPYRTSSSLFFSFTFFLCFAFWALLGGGGTVCGMAWHANALLSCVPGMFVCLYFLALHHHSPEAGTHTFSSASGEWLGWVTMPSIHSIHIPASLKPSPLLYPHR